MKDFTVLGLSGPAGCGKDTAAHHLKNRFGFSVYAFAAPLKAGLNAIFGWDPALWDSRAWKETPLPEFNKSPRQMAQTLGTEWRDTVNRDLWVILAKQQIARVRHAGLPGIVFTDCRFDHEAGFVRGLGGRIIKIRREAAAPVAAHVSEAGLAFDEQDITVANNGTLEELYRSLGTVIATLERQS